MREIKFRTWDTVRGKWITDYVIDPDGFVMCTSNTNTYYDGLHETKVILMQYTGLKDKNGKEIYEGDIVTSVANNKYEWPSMGKVEFINGYFAINTGKALVDSKEDSYANFWHHKNFEIIGNIYENPELLK